MTIVPFDQREGVIWYNGEMVAWKDAKTHVLTHGLHYASSVFEGERVYNGKVFKLREHSERLRRSAELIGFSVPYSAEELDAATMAVIKAQGVSDGYIRPVAWRGSEKMAISAQNNTIHVAIATWPWPPYYAQELHENGISLCWSSWKRPAPDTAPTASKAAGLYMICTMSKHEAESSGYNDAMFLDYRGFIAEATGANVFFVMADGEIHTPLADCFLDGITRRTVIDLARSLGFVVVERRIPPEDLAKAKECFLTGTAAEITPVGEIGEYKFKPAEVTKKLKDAYHQLVRS